MSARPSQKASARARVFFLVLFAFALAVLMASAPRPSKATLQTAADASHKRTRPAFVPGEALVRYRSEAVAKRKAPAMMLSANNQDMAVQIERFEGAEIVPGLRLARMEPEHTLDAIEALNKQPDVLYAEPNYLRQPTTINRNLWAFYNPGGLNMTFTKGKNRGLPIPSANASIADADTPALVTQKAASAKPARCG